MPALILLVLIGAAIVGARLYLNGREGGETAAEGLPASEATPAGGSGPQPATAVRPSAAVVWPGGPCPSCGKRVPRGAKFCAECGRRLTRGSKR